MKLLKNKDSGAKILLIAADLIFIGLLLAIVLVPKGATWYTNIKHKSSVLPNILVSTFYPCVPFFAATTLTLRKIAKTILSGEAFSERMQNNIRKLGMLILILAGMMFIAAFFYYPLFIVSFGAVFCVLLIKIFYDVFASALEKTSVSADEKETEEAADTAGEEAAEEDDKEEISKKD